MIDGKDKARIEAEQFVVSRKKLVNLMLEEHLVSSLKAGNHFNLTIADFGEALGRCRLPIQPPARIEAAIKEFRKRPIGRTVENLTWEGKDEALRWVLCQISDKDFGLDKETPNQKGG